MNFFALRERWLGPALMALCVLVYVPFAGNAGLWDPWETHFAEVARQMAVRGDVISLHYPCSQIENVDFYTKPVLTFWLEAPFLWLFGVTRDAALITSSWRAEWAVRLPHLALAIATIGVVFAVVRRLLDAKTALFSAAILATCPSFFLIAHQAMTDMPFVSTMTVALLLLADALLRPDTVSRPTPIYIALAICGALPLLLITVQLRQHVAMLPYGVALLGCFYLVRRMRSRRDLEFAGAWLCCGLATLAKGPAGLALPAIVVLVFLVVERRFDVFRHLVPGALIFIVVAFPWYHAMLLRHGWAFWNEFIGDNYVNRALGRHGDRGTFEYYAEWASYGLFPWSGLAAIGALRGLTARGSSTRQRLYRFCGVWLLVDFFVLTIVRTKFHHYLLPMVPPLAIVAGLSIDELRARSLWIVALPISLLAGLDLAALPQRLTWLFDYDYVNVPGVGRPYPSPTIYGDHYVFGPSLFAIVLVAIALLALVRKWPALLLAIAISFDVYVVDHVMRELAPHWSQKHVIAAYYRQRTSKEEPLLVWRLFWHGENFYTANQIYEAKDPAERTVFLARSGR